MNVNFIYLGGEFNYPYSLAIESAARTQKVDHIYLWHTDLPLGKYYETIKHRVILKPVEVPRFTSVERTKNEWTKRAHLKDYLAYKILYEEGGIVADLDTLFLKDITDLLGDYDFVVAMDCEKESQEVYPYNSSMFIGRKGSPITKDLMHITKHILNQPWEIQWGSTGPVLVTTVVREHKEKVFVTEHGVLGGFGGHEAKILYDDNGILKENCKVVHLFAHAWKEKFAGITPEYVETSKSLYARLARQVCGTSVDIEAWLKRGQHYRPLFDWLKTHECRNIMEIGTHNGNNAVMMIKEAARIVPVEGIHYWGFDLFEDLTEEAHDREFSYPSPGRVHDIEANIRAQVGATITLTKGDTKETLKDAQGPLMDLIYIDGGHSIETIRSDWANVQKFVDSHTVIFLDDYFPDKDDLGCKFLLREMKGYKVEVLPTIDTYQHKEPLRIQLVRATPKVGVSNEAWLGHQEDERKFWAYDKNVSYGQVKEQAYVPFLGLDKLRKGPYFDLKGMSILDIGGGPVSLLLRCVNFSKGVVLDPCTFEDWILERYKKNDIEFIKHKAEDWEPSQMFDEVWIYNVLQHVQDPDKVVAMAKRAARKIRVFEWRETPLTGGHPHTFTTEDFDRLFGKRGNARNVTKDDMLYDLIHNTEEKFYWGVFDYGKQVAIEPEGCDVGHPLGEAKGDVGHAGIYRRFHLLGYAHLPVSEHYMACAFTQKVVKLSKMLLSLGHEVYLYGSEGSDAPCTEFIQTHTLHDIRDAWGEGDNRFEIGYDWKTKGFKHDFNVQPKKQATTKFYEAAIENINRRKKDDDFLLVMQGAYHKPIADGVNLWLTCEPGIGYRGSYCKYRAFESASLMNFTYGSEHPRQSINGNYYDRVIPNYFDLKDFPFVEKKEDYFFFIGRMISRKGVWTAIKATQAIGAKLILAGQQDSEIDVTKLPSHCEFIGYVEPEHRSELMGKARAVFVPTLYLEAFGGVNVEAQLCGTPVITTNFGVFPETVIHGFTGFLCNTLDDFVKAAEAVEWLNPDEIRHHAERYLMDNVKWEFDRWFQDLYQLYLSARDPSVKGWHYIEETD